MPPATSNRRLQPTTSVYTGTKMTPTATPIYSYSRSHRPYCIVVGVGGTGAVLLALVGLRSIRSSSHHLVETSTAPWQRNNSACLPRVPFCGRCPRCWSAAWLVEGGGRVISRIDGRSLHPTRRLGVRQCRSVVVVPAACLVSGSRPAAWLLTDQALLIPSTQTGNSPAVASLAARSSPPVQAKETSQAAPAQQQAMLAE